MKIAEVCLLTSDVIRLANFYSQILQVSNDSTDEVHQTILSEGTTLTIYNDGSKKNNRNENVCIAFTVEDVDQEYVRLTKLGVKIMERPETRPWGARNMHFLDPDGNHIYFRCFPKM